MLFSAKLRLPADVTNDVVTEFVDEIMEVVELTPLRNALVGLPGMYIPCSAATTHRVGLSNAPDQPQPHQ